MGIVLLSMCFGFLSEYQTEVNPDISHLIQSSPLGFRNSPGPPPPSLELKHMNGSWGELAKHEM